MHVKDHLIVLQQAGCILFEKLENIFETQLRITFKVQKVY